MAIRRKIKTTIHKSRKDIFGAHQNCKTTYITYLYLQKKMRGLTRCVVAHRQRKITWKREANWKSGFERMRSVPSRETAARRICITDSGADHMYRVLYFQWFLCFPSTSYKTIGPSACRWMYLIIRVAWKDCLAAIDVFSMTYFLLLIEFLDVYNNLL